MTPLQQLNQLIAQHALTTARSLDGNIYADNLFHPSLWFLGLFERNLLADHINGICAVRRCGLGDFVLTRAMIEQIAPRSGAFGEILERQARHDLPPLNINARKQLLPMEAEEIIL